MSTGNGGGGGGGGGETKRRPGRPSKRTKPPKLPYNGRVEAPSDSDLRLEFAFDRPPVFKKVFTYFKGINADTLYFLCTAGGFSIVTRDRFRKARVVTSVPAEAVNSYYCDRGGMLFSLRHTDVADAFNSIDKSFWKMSISARHDIPDEITITFKDHVLGKECVNRVKVTILTEIPEDDRDLLDAQALIKPRALGAAPVRFELTAKQFKKTISDAVRRKSTALIVEKLGAHPMQIVDKGEGSGGGSAYNEVYRKAAAISLKSDVADDDVMRCTFQVAVVKSLATAMVADVVGIHCYRDGSGKDMVLVSPIVDDEKRDADGNGPSEMVRIATVVEAYDAYDTQAM